MAGFDNDVCYGFNLDFRGVEPVQATLVSDGQMLIASTALNVGGTHINVGTLTSPSGTVTIGYSSPNITLDVPGAGTAWSEKNSNFTAAADNGYFCTAALTVTLPSGNLGDTIIINVDTANTVILQAAAGQIIRVANNASAVAGTISSNKQGDSITLNYRASTLTWFASSSMGNWSIN